MLSTSLIQFSLEKLRGCVPSLLFDLRPNYGGGNEDNGDLLQKVPCMPCCTQNPPDTAAGHRRPTPLLETPGHSWACLGQFLVRSLPLSPGSRCAQGFVLFAPSKSVFPQSCVTSGGSMVGLMVISSKRAYAIPRSAALKASVAGHC